jgi:2-polyprenyl-3-methyl-5-hydroxy-6-metoxy-1,4-benzoquinol methylase
MKSTRTTPKYNCLLCNAENHTVLHNRARHNKTVLNYICENCGFVFILPRLSSEDLDLLYKENTFSKNERGVSAPDDKKFSQCENIARTRLEILIDIFEQKNIWPSNNYKSVLEVGCGTASFLRLMRGCGWDVLGLEPDITYAQASAERYNIEIRTEFISDLTIQRKFDLIASFHVIEHVDDPNLFLTSLHEYLSDDGYLFLECPSIDKWYGDSIEHFFWDVHINTFSRKTLLAFLAKAGFQIIADGWNGIGLWVIAKKAQQETLPIIWDSPQRIKAIVQKAVSESETATNSPQLAKFRKLISLAKKGLALVKNSPSEIPARILSKITTTTNPLDAQNIALKPDKKIKVKALKIAHVGLHVNGNAGDTLLFPAVRWLFQKEVSPTSFTLIPLHRPVTQEIIDQINQQDALVIGGGGLFLRDTNPNNKSGWQWGCSLELLEQIKVPIILFAVGYNRFRGQEDFSPVFEENIKLLIEKSIFVGIRNRGSIEALKSYLPKSLQGKIHYQPCPTTILKHFYPDLPEHNKKSKPILAVNIAFDRHHLRFGKQEDRILWSMADAFLELERQGWQIKLFNHMPTDSEARFWFRKRGLFAEEVNIGGVPPQSILQEYSQPTITVGMRGHAQMIPFGLHRPIYSLISHDKLQFFLDDIEHSDWGVEVQDSNLSEKLVKDISEMYANLHEIETQLELAQNKLWEITLQNIQMFKGLI